MSPTTEQQILSAVSEVATELGKLRAAVLDENGEGRLPVAERRINDHAGRLKKLETDHAGLPCKSHNESLTDINKRIRRLEYLGALLMGGGALLVWELQMAIDLLKMTMAHK